MMSGVGSCSSGGGETTEYDVFISFRGEDTRDGFTSHLYKELCRRGIRTFIDDRLVRGNDIKHSLEKAIQDSAIYVVVFSQHYASSSWCLDELAFILDCKDKFQREVIPVFYKVDPSTVRHQKASYAEAFLKHEQRFNHKVIAWKAALNHAAGFSGWDSKVIRSEAKLVEGIAQHILTTLNRSTVSDNKGLIGIDNHIKQIESMLRFDSKDVRIIGIWGMGGLGKTTIARAIVAELATRFGSSSFVENVDQLIKNNGGTEHARQKYLSELLEEERGGQMRSLQRTKVLLVLDNVNKASELNDLIGGHHSFGSGSRVIVTSRDKQVFNNVADDIYEVKEMSFPDSLKLFSLKAFKQNHPPTETFMDLSEKVLNYAKGVPLALIVLGSLLYGKTEEEYESQLQKLKKLPDSQTFDALKLSYEGLDDEQKDIFLDIACFYNGQEMNIVKQTLNDCGFSAAIGIQVLIDRCLVSTLNRKIVMHDLVQDMGREIVHQQCVNDPGKRSRLWRHEDIFQVFKRDKGTDAIQCIFLDLCKIRKVGLHPETFKMMHNLRLLQCYKSDSKRDSQVHIPAFLISLPDELRILRWDGFPQNCLPTYFCPEHLVELDMCDSHLERLWDGDQDFPSLKRLNLCGSRRLKQIPDLSQCSNIEVIILSHCVKLKEVSSSSFLSKLNCLCLDRCGELQNLNLPSSILSRSSGLIFLNGCDNLENFSVGVLSFSCSQATELKILCLGRIHSYDQRLFSDAFQPIASDDDIYEKPRDSIPLINLEMLKVGLPLSSFQSLNELCWLDLSYCASLTSFLVDLSEMKFLRKLYLPYCSNFHILPEINQTMENLTVIILDHTPIQEVPSSWHHLVGLEELSLQSCQRLEFIPSSIGGLSRLRKLDLTNCESLQALPSSIFKLKLTELDLRGCRELRSLPEITEPAESIAHLWLTSCAIKELPSSLDNLVGLRTLRLNLCRDLEFLPDSIANLKLLSELDCSSCSKLTEIPNEIGHLTLLREFSLQGTGIVNLPDSIANLSSLKSLDLSDCKKLECIPKLPPSLKQLLAFDCPSVKRVSSSRVEQVPQDPKDAIFKFHFTNSQELDSGSQITIAADARHRIIQDAYMSVFFCFPRSTVPSWFRYKCKGSFLCLDNAGSLNWCKDDRLIGFALCIVLANEMVFQGLPIFSYRLTFKSDDGVRIVPSHGFLGYTFRWKGVRSTFQNHTLVWKHHLEPPTPSIKHMLSHVDRFTFEIFENIGGSYNRSPSRVKECGICPLYRKEKR